MGIAKPMEDETIRLFRHGLRDWFAARLSGRTWPSVHTEQGLRAQRAWASELYDAGYGVLGWPAEFGGRGADLAVETVFQEEYLRAGAPERLNRFALGMVAPTLLEFGTQQQKQRWLEPLARCEDVWCQGFSEPEAGSDLTSLATRAEVDRDELVVTGHKIWTTYATLATWMFALVRTARTDPPRDGITFVMIPMDAAGLTVRPIRQLHGEPNFAEVFLDEVPVPLANVIGELNQGWAIARRTLSFERAAALASHVAISRDVRALVATARATGAASRPEVRALVARCYATAEAFRTHSSNGLRNPSFTAASVTKLVSSQLRRQVYDTTLECLDGRADVEGFARLERDYWHARASEIFGGASELQRDIIGLRELQLPRERA